MANDCLKHAGANSGSARAHLEQKLSELDECQAGAGRHKCAYCAFELGQKEGYEQAKREIQALEEGRS